MASSPDHPQLSRQLSRQLSGRAFFAGMVLGSLAVALVICAVPYLPTNDGPQHVFAGVVLKAFSDPGTAYSAVLEPLPAFAERGFSMVFVPLLEVFSWRVALSVTLVVVALSGAWSFAALSCALAKGRTPWAFLGFALAFPWTFYMGFLPFVLAANIGVGVIAYAVSREEARRTQLVALSAMLLVEAVMHVGAALMTGLVVLLVFVMRAPRGQRLRTTGLVALTGVPAAVVLAGVLLTSSHARGSGEPWMWTPRMEWLVELPRYALPGPMPRALLGTALVVVGLGAGLRRALRHEGTRAELAVLTVAFLFIAVALVGPLDLPGWQLVAPRFASLGLPLAVALLAPMRPIRSTRMLLAAITVTTALSLLVTYDLHRRLSRGCEPALAGLSAPVVLEGSTLPLPLDTFCGVASDPSTSEVPHLAPLFHVGALYAAARGGLTPYMFGGASAIHAFRYRAGRLPANAIPPSPSPAAYLALAGGNAGADPALRAYLLARFAEYGAAHGHLLVVGARDGELANILTRGYVADWQSDSAMIAHPRSCPLDVVVHADDPDHVRVEVGQRPAGEVAIAIGGAGAEPLSDGGRRIKFAAGGCGPVWVRGYLDVDGSGDASKGDVFCTDAGRDGRLDVDLAAGAEVACRIERRTRPAAP
jgi:hypothetical protein